MKVAPIERIGAEFETSSQKRILHDIMHGSLISLPSIVLTGGAVVSSKLIKSSDAKQSCQCSINSKCNRSFDFACIASEAPGEIHVDHKQCPE